MADVKTEQEAQQSIKATISKHHQIARECALQQMLKNLQQVKQRHYQSYKQLELMTMYSKKASLQKVAITTGKLKLFIAIVLPKMNQLYKTIKAISILIEQYKDKAGADEQFLQQYQRLMRLEDADYLDNGLLSAVDDTFCPGFRNAPHVKDFPLNAFASLPRQDFNRDYQYIEKHHSLSKYKKFYKHRLKQARQIELNNRLIKSLKTSIRHESLAKDIAMVSQANFNLYHLPEVVKDDFKSFLIAERKQCEEKISQLKNLRGFFLKLRSFFLGGLFRKYKIDVNSINNKKIAAKTLLVDCEFQGGLIIDDATLEKTAKSAISHSKKILITKFNSQSKKTK